MATFYRYARYVTFNDAGSQRRLGMSGRIVRVLLVEVPCVVLEMNGKVLGEVTTNHAKYPQMLLAANLRKLTNDSQEFEVDSRPFAKFVEAIDPSLGEMVLVGGWAHRL